MQTLELGFLLAVGCLKLFVLARLLLGKRLHICPISLSFALEANLNGGTCCLGLCLKVSQISVACLGVNVEDDIGSKVRDLLEVAHRNAEQKAHCTGRAAHKPNMRNRGGQANVPHPLAAHDRLSDKLAILVYCSFAAAHTLELAVVWVDIFDWAKNTLTKQAIALRLLGSIVNRLRLGDFAVAPLEDILGAGDGQAYRIKIGDIVICYHVGHLRLPPRLGFLLCQYLGRTYRCHRQLCQCRRIHQDRLLRHRSRQTERFCRQGPQQQ